MWGLGPSSSPAPPEEKNDAHRFTHTMESVYDEIEIEDFTYDPITQLFQYPCPCGDRFAISIDDLRDGEDIAVCPSCSLMVRVIFDPEDLEEYNE